MEQNKTPLNGVSHSGSFGLKAVALIGTTAIMAGLLAFLVFPVISGRDEGLDVFTALCRAIGLQTEPASQIATRTTGSTVAFDAVTLHLLESGDAVKGRDHAADVCAACHLPNGFTSDPNTMPTITGQSARAIFKQLRDIKSGVRVSDIMKPIVEALDDQQMSDLAAYYSGLRRRNDDNPEGPAISQNTIDLVLRGDTARALPACAACHEARSGGPVEAPNLTGQYPPYVETQLKAFADGTRRNDLYSRMRIIAKKLTPQEISELSAYYNAPPYPPF
ncbi:MAG: cytochrome c [Rhodospirillaceae bacterium]